MRSALVELYLEGGEEAQDAAWAALLAAEAFCRPNKLAALTELTRRLVSGTHTAKVRTQLSLPCCGCHLRVHRQTYAFLSVEGKDDGFGTGTTHAGIHADDCRCVSCLQGQQQG